MIFEDIIGQKQVIKTLKNSIMSGKVGHAWIFAGPEGIGKKTMASAFAAALLCQPDTGELSLTIEEPSMTIEEPFPDTEEPSLAIGEPSFATLTTTSPHLKELSSVAKGNRCGNCPSCRLFDAGTHPDFHLVNPTDSNILIEDTRKILASIIIRPYIARYKVYVIADADRLTDQAQNNLLKTLESPPSYAVIILTTANYEALLGTVRSRVTRIIFQRNSDEEIVEIVREKFKKNIEDADLASVVACSSGIPGFAEKLTIDTDFVDLRNSVMHLVFQTANDARNFQSENFGELPELFEKNKESSDLIFGIMLSVYRDMLAAKAHCDNVLINADKKDMILDNMRLFSKYRLIRNSEAIMDAMQKLRRNASYMLTIQELYLKLQDIDRFVNMATR